MCIMPVAECAPTKGISIQECFSIPKRTCDQFNETTNVCMAHERRPEFCRGFPFYGHEHVTEILVKLYPRCGYWEIDEGNAGERSQTTRGKERTHDDRMGSVATGPAGSRD